MKMQASQVDCMLLSVKEVAGALGISERHFWNLCSAGRFGPRRIRLARSVKINRDEFLAWVEAGCPCSQEWEVMQGALQ